MNSTAHFAKRFLTSTIALFCTGSAYAAMGMNYLGQQPAGNTAHVTSIVTQTCAACHGVHGNSLMAGYPNLAGQNASYLIKQLEDFHAGNRTNPIMQAMVATIPANQFSQDVKDIAYYFSRQPFDPKANANATAPKTSLKVLKLGEDIYRSGLSEAGVPACMACHEANGMGNGPMAIPRLAGQHSAYIITQLLQFRDNERHNDPHRMMRMIASRLNKKEMTAVAYYAQALRPALILGSGPENYEQAEQSQFKQLIGVPADQIAVPETKTSVAPPNSAPKS